MPYKWNNLSDNWDRLASHIFLKKKKCVQLELLQHNLLVFGCFELNEKSTQILNLSHHFQIDLEEGLRKMDHSQDLLSDAVRLQQAKLGQFQVSLIVFC